MCIEVLSCDTFEAVDLFPLHSRNGLRVPQPNAPATYLWSDGLPDMSASVHYQFMEKAIQNPAVQQFVQVLFNKLKPPAAVYKEHLRQAFSPPAPHVLPEENQELEEESMHIASDDA